MYFEVVDKRYYVKRSAIYRMRSGDFFSIMVISCREALIGPLLMDLERRKDY